MKPNLISGTYTDAGTVAIIYADQASDLGGDEYVGVNKEELASGSVAYDKLLNTYVFNGENWVKDDGTVVQNESEDFKMFFDFELTETASSDPSWLVVNTDVTAEEVIEAVKSGKLAVARCTYEGTTGMAAFAVIVEYQEANGLGSEAYVGFECAGEDGFTLRVLPSLAWVYAMHA